MQRDKLMAEKVVAVRDALRDRERHLALVGDHPLHAPDPVLVQPILVDLEPLQARRGRRRGVARVRHFGEVGDDRAFVRLVDGVGRVGRGRARQSVVPFGGEGRACGDVHDGGGDGGVVGVDAAVADDVVGGDVLDGLMKLSEVINMRT